VQLTSTPSVEAALASYKDYVASQVLADDIALVESLDGENVTELDIDGEKILAKVTRK
ncbi:MAG: hypothetical protein HDR94_02505, partial [Bacteroides sp.]|nr:hypothetical protein [Bacteroides sp.]